MLLLLRSPPPPAGDPSTISGLTARFRADSLALANGANVTSWADGSGNGYTATTGASAAPTFQGSVLNTQPVVRFGGAASLTSAVPDGAVQQTIFVVTIPNATDGTLFGSLGANGAGGLQLRTSASKLVLSSAASA